MAVKPIPAGYTAVTPYLIVRDVDRLLEFLKSAFNATIVDVHRAGDGRVMHADVTIGGAHIMMGQATERFPEKRPNRLILPCTFNTLTRSTLTFNSVSTACLISMMR